MYEEYILYYIVLHFGNIFWFSFNAMYLGENTRKVLLDMSKDFLLMSKQAKQPYFSDTLKNNSNCVIILSIFFLMTRVRNL